MDVAPLGPGEAVKQRWRRNPEPRGPGELSARCGGQQGIPDSQQRFCSVMGESPPIACTLTAADLRDRQGAWAKLLGRGLVNRDRVEGGIRLHAASGAAAALIELIDLERECCAWIQFKVTRDPIAGEVDVLLIAEGEGEEILAGMFVVG